MDRWRTTTPRFSIHFPREAAHEPNPSLLWQDSFLVLQIAGQTIDSKSDLIGSIEGGLACPWFAEADPGESSNWDGFLDVLRSWTEWLVVAGMVVALHDAKDLWARLYGECGTLVETWLEAAATAERLQKPMHLAFVEGPLPNTASANGWQAVRLFRGVEAVRWMPEGAILAE